MSDSIAPLTASAATQEIPTATPTISPGVEPHSHSSATSPETEKLLQWTREDLVAGKITQAQGDKIFSDLDIPLDQRTMPDDTRTDEHKLMDAHFPVAKESDYSIRYFPPGREPQTMPPELKEFDQSARTWLVGAEFPRELGNSLVTEIERVAQTTKGMNPSQLEAYGEAEYVKLQRAYGGEDKLQEKLHAAAVMIHELDQKRPGLKNLLRSRALGDSALVVSQLIAQAERYHTRRKGR